MKMTDVIIYGTSMCKWCDKAKELADRYNIKWEFRNVEDLNLYEELKSLQPTFKTVPQIYWNGNYIGGYEKFMFEIENTIGGYGDGKI
jgi:glutaredoxin